MSREMMVGGEHIVGAQRSHDYDELMELGAEPARHPIQIRQVPQAGHPAQATHPQPAPQHGQQPVHEIHHHYAPPAAENGRAAHGEPQRRRIVSEEPTHERQFPIGFAFENIAAGDEEDIEVKPQVYFRGERLAIPPSIARFFDVLDIKVGKDSQLAATGTMPGESFSAHAVGVRMELDTAKPGIVITLRVRNVDTAAHDFKAVLYGAVLE